MEAGEGGLARRSVVLVSQLDTVRKEALGERLGQVAEQRVEQVLGGLRMQQRSFFRR